MRKNSSKIGIRTKARKKLENQKTPPNIGPIRIVAGKVKAIKNVSASKENFILLFAFDVIVSLPIVIVSLIDRVSF